MMQVFVNYCNAMMLIFVDRWRHALMMTVDRCFDDVDCWSFCVRR